MNVYNQITPFPFKGLYKMAAALGMLLIQGCLFAQQATVLPGNGSFAQPVVRRVVYGINVDFT